MLIYDKAKATREAQSRPKFRKIRKQFKNPQNDSSKTKWGGGTFASFGPEGDVCQFSGPHSVGKCPFVVKLIILDV